MQLGDQIKKRRQALGISIEDIAGKAGIDPTHWSRIERNKHGNLTSDTLKNIARALGVSINQLYGEKPISPGFKHPQSKEEERRTLLLMKYFKDLSSGNQTLAVDFVKMLSHHQSKK